MPATLEAPAKTDEMMVFRLNSGCHEDTQEGWERPKDKDGKPIYTNEMGQPILVKSHIYRYNEPGNNVVRSKRNLAKQDPEKFTLLSGDGDVVDQRALANMDLLRENEQLLEKLKVMEEENSNLRPKQEKMSTAPGLDGMTGKQLAEYCNDNELETKGCKSREDFLAVAKGHANKGK